MGAEVNLVSKLGEAMINAGDLLKLKEGDVIALDTRESDEIQILVEGMCKFKGRPGAVKGKTALEVTQLLTSGQKE